MQKTVYYLSAAYVFLLVAMWLSILLDSTMDNMSRGMSFGFLMVYAAVVAVCILPALFLARRGIGLEWAIGLAVAPGALALLAMLG